MPRAEQRDWIMVRIRRTTHQRLTELAEMWKRERERRNDLPAPDDRDRIGLDRVISELIDRDDSHRRRGRKKVSARKRTLGPATPGGGPTVGNAPPSGP